MRGKRSMGLAAALALGVAGCGELSTPRPQSADDTRGGAAIEVSGPLCQALPAGDDPGAPQSIAGEKADVVLTWIPVATMFEAAVRATGLDRELHVREEPVTILAPTDEAFQEAFDEQTMDELLLERQDELRELLESHMFEGSLSLAELRDAGELTTLAGRALEIEPADAMLEFGDRAKTVCADYAAANARIHVVDAVLPSRTVARRPPSARPPSHRGEAE
jgi:uncharacterized surface protein with fasciclin (FAS1) repeats